IVISKSDSNDQGVIASMQRTWSEGVHATEIRGGLTGFDPTFFSEETRDEYLFDMNGMSLLRLCSKKLPLMFDDFFKENNLSMDDVDLLIPHQASRALPLIMKKLNVPKGKYVDMVKDYGNMVSVSVPHLLCKLLEDKTINKGDKILLCGTAAGLTSNILLMQI
ncbi:MAG: 3-oxoacyl-[acyl-carrier-protein] synthase III C-terminal domain-containing protein, partial [Bacilli bacterium]|nr:3-oxoacyl-[acyl-carrier-protein] synthase III C-terminal domain-containing protein [Bacilli bacterium]